MKKEELIILLWLEFKEKIFASWSTDYHRQFGPPSPLQEIDQPFIFARAVHKKATQQFATEELNVQIVSADTLNNTFQKDGISPKAKNKTLDFFAAFTGHQNWKAFEMKQRHLRLEAPPDTTPVPKAIKLAEAGDGPEVKIAKQAPQVVTPPVEAVPAEPAPERASQNKWWRWLLMLVVVGLAYFIYFQVQRQRIVALVHAVNQSEFAAYQAVPTIDTAYFSRYLMPGSSSRKEVGFVLSKSVKSGYRLRVPPSSHTVLKVSVWPIWWNTAYVTSREKWYLRWYDTGTNKLVKKYDKVNSQDYLLRYHDGQWRVEANAYESNHITTE